MASLNPGSLVDLSHQAHPLRLLTKIWVLFERFSSEAHCPDWARHHSLTKLVLGRGQWGQGTTNTHGCARILGESGKRQNPPRGKFWHLWRKNGQIIYVLHLKASDAELDTTETDGLLRQMLKTKTRMNDVCLETKWITLGFFIFKEHVLSNCIVSMRFSAFC